MARLTILAVSGVGLFSLHRKQVSETNEASLFEASLSQFATESWTYFEGSARIGSSKGMPRDGSSSRPCGSGYARGSRDERLEPFANLKDVGAGIESGDAEIAFACGAETGAWCDDHLRFS